MINCKPYGGISNRLKCIISSLVEYENINLIWDIPKHGGGVRCEFGDLYQNNFQGKSHQIISSCDFIHQEMNTHNQGEKNVLPNDLKNRYIQTIKTLKPTEYITKRVQEEKDKLGVYTTVSVRTFKSFPEEYNSWGRYFKIENLLNVMDGIDGKILLTCDDDETKEIISERYDVYTTPKRTNFGDFTTVNGM